jgi:plastocyanin
VVRTITVCALLLLAACGGDDDVAGGGQGAGGDSVTVGIVEFAFDPAEIAIAVGDSVVFHNEDGFAHTAQAEDGSFDTGDIGGDASSDAVTFDEPGTYPFFCGIHNYMTGTVTVT